MKEIINFINEKLKINSKSKINNSRGILDEKIEYLKDLIPICQTYFEQFYKIEISKISSSEQKWKYYNTNNGIIVKNHFEIKFYFGNKCNKKLRFANYGEYILMQILILNHKGKWETCRIHGGSKINEFKRGDNFLDFILRIKKHTDENNIIGRDNNLMQLFKDLYNENK